MAKLFIAEFKYFGYGQRGSIIPAPREPAAVVQTPVDFSSGEAKSEIFADSTRYVLLTADVDCHVLFGANPTATTDDMPIWAKLYAGFSIEKAATMKLSVIGA